LRIPNPHLTHIFSIFRLIKLKRVCRNSYSIHRVLDYAIIITGMSELEKVQNNFELKKPFDTTCKGPRLGKSFYFVAVPEIKAESMTERVEDGLTMTTFPSRKLDTLDPQDIQKVTNEADYKGVLKKQTLRSSMSMSKERTTTMDAKKKYMAPILKKSRYVDSESGKEPLARTTTLAAEKKPQKNKLTFKEEIQEVKVVENWKIYNQETYTSTNTCYCNTF